MDLGLDGRAALILGGSSGIGLGIARSLSREGARVALTSRSAERATQAASTLVGVAAGIEADTEDLERLGLLPSLTAEALGAPVSILVTNTGGPPPGGALETERADWDRAFRSLVLAPRELIKACVPAMRDAGWGRIVNVGSAVTIEHSDRLAISSSLRRAAEGLFKGLARGLAADGITLNTIATGRIATDRLVQLDGSPEAAVTTARREVPVGRLGTPDEYGNLVAFLCSERAAYLTGAVIPLDGGLLRA